MKKRSISATNPWQTISIFISSTFSDMQAERDYLRKYVFPEVEEEMRMHRVNIRIIDLRWGVNTLEVNEEEREDTVLKVCLDEINRCRPFFIGLLGDRYGWMPSPEKIIDAVETGDKKSIITGDDQQQSVTELEIRYGVLSDYEQMSRSLFYFRSEESYSGMDTEALSLYRDSESGLGDYEKELRIGKLQKLKETIRGYYRKNNLKEKVSGYTVRWEKGTFTGFEEWGKKVRDDLLGELFEHLEFAESILPENRMEQYELDFDSFVNQHTRSFAGREKEIVKIQSSFYWPVNKSAYKKDGYKLEPKPVVLSGESGSGKSSIFCKIYKELSGKGDIVLAYSAGISPRSRRTEDMLLYFVWKLMSMQGKPFDVERDYDFYTLKALFYEQLDIIRQDNNIIVMVDSVDRFASAPYSESISWFPVNMENCTGLVTVTDEKVSLIEKVQSRQIDFIKLEPLSIGDATLIIENYSLKFHGKKFYTPVKDALLEKKVTDDRYAFQSPLWLKLAVNIFLTFDKYDFDSLKSVQGTEEEKILRYMLNMVEELPPDVGQIFRYQLKRAGRDFGEAYVQELFMYLAVSHNGLTEYDLVLLLSGRFDELKFASLRRMFLDLLVETGENKRWSLSHPLLKSSILSGTGAGALSDIHHELVDKLWGQPVYSITRMYEIPYSLLHINDIDRLILYLDSGLNEEAMSITAEALLSYCVNDPSLLKAVMSAAGTGHTDSVIRLMKFFVYDFNEKLELASLYDMQHELHLYWLNRLNLLKDEIVSEEYVRLFIHINTVLGDLSYNSGLYSMSVYYFFSIKSLLRNLKNEENYAADLIPAAGMADYKLAVTFHILGRYNDSAECFTRAESIYKYLLDHQPENMVYMETLALICTDYAGLLYGTCRFADAGNFYGFSEILAEKIGALNPGSFEYFNVMSALLNYRAKYVELRTDLRMDAYARSFNYTRQMLLMKPHDVGIKERMISCFYQWHLSFYVDWWFSFAADNIASDLIGLFYNDYSRSMRIWCDEYIDQPRSPLYLKIYAMLNLNLFNIFVIKETDNQVKTSVLDYKSLFKKGKEGLREYYFENPENEQLGQLLAEYMLRSLAYDHERNECMNLCKELYTRNPGSIINSMLYVEADFYFRQDAGLHPDKSGTCKLYNKKVHTLMGVMNLRRYNAMEGITVGQDGLKLAGEIFNIYLDLFLNDPAYEEYKEKLHKAFDTLSHAYRHYPDVNILLREDENCSDNISTERSNSNILLHTLNLLKEQYEHSADAGVKTGIEYVMLLIYKNLGILYYENRLNTQALDIFRQYVRFYFKIERQFRHIDIFDDLHGFINYPFNDLFTNQESDRIILDQFLCLNTNEAEDRFIRCNTAENFQTLNDDYMKLLDLLGKSGREKSRWEHSVKYIRLLQDNIFFLKQYPEMLNDYTEKAYENLHYSFRWLYNEGMEEVLAAHLDFLKEIIEKQYENPSMLSSAIRELGGTGLEIKEKNPVFAKDILLQAIDYTDMYRSFLKPEDCVYINSWCMRWIGRLPVEAFKDKDERNDWIFKARRLLVDNPQIFRNEAEWYYEIYHFAGGEYFDRHIDDPAMKKEILESNMFYAEKLAELRVDDIYYLGMIEDMKRRLSEVEARLETGR